MKKIINGFLVVVFFTGIMFAGSDCELWITAVIGIVIAVSGLALCFLNRRTHNMDFSDLY